MCGESVTGPVIMYIDAQTTTSTLTGEFVTVPAVSGAVC